MDGPWVDDGTLVERASGVPFAQRDACAIPIAAPSGFECPGAKRFGMVTRMWPRTIDADAVGRRLRGQRGRRLQSRARHFGRSHARPVIAVQRSDGVAPTEAVVEISTEVGGASTLALQVNGGVTACGRDALEQATWLAVVNARVQRVALSGPAPPTSTRKRAAT